MTLGHRSAIQTIVTERIGWWFLVVGALLASSLVQPAWSDVEHTAQAQRTTAEIRVDGRLDEPVWQAVQPISQFAQLQPNEGEAISLPTEIRILYDDEKLYFGYTCYDPDIERLTMSEMRRDANGLKSDDHGFLLLDPYNDRRSAVFFRFNALGGVEDTAVSRSGDSLNESWDIVWECQGSIESDHWIAELAIPFSQLRFNENAEMTWGMNCGRSIARYHELSVWSPVPKAYGPLGKYKTAYFGSLTDLEGITPSRHIELLPYVSPGVSRIEEGDDTDPEIDAGLDVKYGITPNLTADLTINTDFAQVEADEEQVNLSRFSLFFPEKRPFFMEGAGLFDFGTPRLGFDRPPPLLLFYSRRIGLAEESAIPIIAGAKVTGKMGPFGVGLLNVLTDDYQDTEAEEPIDELITNYSVLRVTRDVLEGSSVGFIGVNKQNDDTYNRAAGIDFSYRPTKALDIRGLWARTFDEDVPQLPPVEEDEKTNAWYLGTAWRNNRFQADGSYMDIGKDFNPEVGFIHREDIRQMRGGFRYTPWPRRFGVRSMGIGPSVDTTLDHGNNLLTRDISFGTDLDFESGHRLGFDLVHTREWLDEDFEIREAILIPQGDHSFASVRLSASTDGSRRVSARVGGGVGDFFDGTRRGFSVSANVKPNAQLSIAPMFDFNRVELPGGKFDASIFAARVGYSLSPRFFTKLFMQWNSDEDQILTNFLLNYIYRPGSDLYFVLNQTYGTGDEHSGLLETTVIAKLTYWWNP